MTNASYSICEQPTYFMRQQTEIYESGYADGYNYFYLILPYSTNELGFYTFICLDSLE